MTRYAQTHHIALGRIRESSEEVCEMTASLEGAFATMQASQIRQAISRLTKLLEEKTRSAAGEIETLADQIINGVANREFDEFADLLSRSCFHLFEIGQSSVAIGLGNRLAARADQFGNIAVKRRISNILGGQYCDIADFAAAMACLETAVVLARRIGDQTMETACLANVIALLQEMGHYRQAIVMAERVLHLDDDSHLANMLKLQCASNGLFAAHRIGDKEAAAKFLAEGQRYLSRDAEPLRRAFFERSRVLYLVDLGETAKAQALLDETMIAIGHDANPRIRTLLTIASAVCDWASGSKQMGRSTLEQLGRESRVSRLYYHFVLQALTKVYSDSSNPADAATGLLHAKELVEFTTSVKKAKFYRQLANRRDEPDVRTGSVNTSTLLDPFHIVKDWLSASDVMGPGGEPGAPDRRELTKHEELTVIHEDMAKLRVAALRRDIRTDAVDTAENWAVAAEFFDDETGQHCYRVGHLAAMLAREIGLDEMICVRIEHAARLHDIGKIAVNEVILLKPGPLDAAEMAAMRLHTEVGAQILSGSEDPTLKVAVDIARHHHEWWNGAGYPVKLVGANIPIAARICAYADVYDALTHARAYKKAWTHERALEEIQRLIGAQFDPDFMDPFCRVVVRYRSDLKSSTIPAFADMRSNALIASRRKLMETIGAESR